MKLPLLHFCFLVLSGAFLQTRRMGPPRVAPALGGAHRRPPAVPEREGRPGALPERPDLGRGTLWNGLQYLVLPGDGAGAGPAAPPPHTEVHLEVLSGSTSELDHEQGMAHLLEHVAFMESPSRQLLAGQGARTNAYTDFHHTVYHAASPREDLLPHVLEALSAVLSAPRIDEASLSKEKAAVLSEMGMINSVEHRADRAVLSALHSESALPSRFPIGREELIRAWSVDDVRAFHSRHYRPDNAVLYVVGAADVASAVHLIGDKFGSLKSAVGRGARRPRPPLRHLWAGAAWPPLRNATVFQHPLLHHLSFHVLAKDPIVSIRTMNDLKADILKRIVLEALLVRLTILNRGGTLCSQISVDSRAFPREGCEVCSLDLVTGTDDWKSALGAAVEEVGRLAAEGITSAELTRCIRRIRRDAALTLAGENETDNEAKVEALMQDEACGHTHLHPSVRRDMTEAILRGVTSQDVSAAAAQMFAHFSSGAAMPSTDGSSRGGAEFPAAVVACAPSRDSRGSEFRITGEEVVQVLQRAVARAQLPRARPPSVPDVPQALISRAQMDRALAAHPPRWLEQDGSDGGEAFRHRMSNGVPVSFVRSRSEPNTASLRLLFRGGRQLETDGARGAVVLGARTIQEGGAFRSLSQEAVELFCLDHAIMLEVSARADALTIDIKVGLDPEDQLDAPSEAAGGGGVSNLEAALQVARLLMTELKWEERPFLRARQQEGEEGQRRASDLELACREEAVRALTAGAPAHCAPAAAEMRSLQLKTVADLMTKQLSPGRLEVAIAGDASARRVRDLALRYLGSLPSPADSTMGDDIRSSFDPQRNVNATREVVVPDTEARGVGYIAGLAPSQWGVFGDGQSLGEALRQHRRRAGREGPDEPALTLLQARALMLLLQEIASERLFSIVRDQRQLTYNADFKFEADGDRQHGGFFAVTVTSPPALLSLAIDACGDALNSLTAPAGARPGFGLDDVEAAKQRVKSRVAREARSSQWLLEQLLGPEGLRDVSGVNQAIDSLTLQDVQDAASVILQRNPTRVTVRGVSAQSPP